MSKKEDKKPYMTASRISSSGKILAYEVTYFSEFYQNWVTLPSEYGYHTAKATIARIKKEQKEIANYEVNK